MSPKNTSNSSNSPPLKPPPPLLLTNRNHTTNITTNNSNANHNSFRNATMSTYFNGDYSNHVENVDNHEHRHLRDWVEIEEPRSKTKIYANLESGLCAKVPPEGAIVSKTEEFSDHWWELFDKKSGKYYYYNPEKKKTSWTRPDENPLQDDKDNTGANKNKRLLIIPVSKLQILRQNPSGPEYSDASNQVIKCDASTQTHNTNLVSTSTQTIDSSQKHIQQQQQQQQKIGDNPPTKDGLSSFKPSGPNVYTKKRLPSISNNHQSIDNIQQSNQAEVSCKSDKHNDLNQSNCKNIEDGIRSINLKLSSNESNEDAYDDTFDDQGDPEEDDYRSSVNTPDDLRASKASIEYKKSLTNHSSSPDSSTHISHLSLNINNRNRSPLTCETSTPPMTFFGFKEFINDEIDPSTCMSQQLDHRKLVENFKKSRQSSLLGTHLDLNHRTGNRNYQMDSHHHHISATQMFKNMADSYFIHGNNNNTGQDDRAASDRHLRQLSTLSTLPRPRKDTKDKIALSRPEQSNYIVDADYDIVEDNCGYYSDSEQQLQQTSHSSSIDQNIKTGDYKGTLGPINPNFDRNKSTRGSTFSVESFARENFSKHAKKGVGLFNRKVNWSRMISWTKSGIKHPMISSISSDLNSDSIATFKLIQQYMGDRDVTMNKKFRQLLSKGPSLDGEHIHRSMDMSSSSLETSHSADDRLRDEIANELVAKGCQKSGLRDEIFIQLARQLTENPNQESVRLGFVLMSILTSYFSPSTKFAPFILSFLECHQHPIAKDVCLPRLLRRLNQNCATYCRKPIDGDEISIVRLSITNWPQSCGVFGESLSRIMSLQECSPYLKRLRLPWILTALGKKLLETGGPTTEGIFRCAADHDLIAQLRLKIDCVDMRKITDEMQIQSILANVQDPHVIAGLLKLFFRQLTEPVFPSHLYELCLQNSQDGMRACRIFCEHMSNLHKDVAAYLIRLLQFLSKPEMVSITKMDSSNLAMVWAPNLLRAPQRDENVSDSKWSISNWTSLDEPNNSGLQAGASQSSIFEQTRQEMQFIRSLLTSLDTSFIDNVV